MKCLVTGGAGFIASHLVDKLIERGNQVVIVDNLSTGDKDNLNSQAVFYRADIQSPEISQIFKKEKPEVVFHYAAQINVRESVENPLESAKTNILGSLNVLENCKGPNGYPGVKKVVFASSGGAIYGEAETIPTPEEYPAKPASPYGLEKLITEQYLDYYKRAYGIDYLALRFANVYGPRQNAKGEAGVVAIFCSKMQAGDPVVINGDGLQTRDFIFVDDVIKANLLGFEGNKSGIFNIGTAKETDINTIFGELKKMFDSKVQETHGPAKEGEQKRSCLDFAQARKELGWQPEYILNEGLKKTQKWFDKTII